MKVLDTTFLIDLLRGNRNTLKILKKREILLTTQINMYEILRGFFINKSSKKKLLEVNEFFDNIRLLNFDDTSLIKSAEISADLINKGQIISDCDCMTAGIALSNGITEIVTKNVKHFEKIKGIKVIKY